MDSSPGVSSHHHHHHNKIHFSKKRESNGETRHYRHKNSYHKSSKSHSRSSSVESKSKRAYINPSPKFNFFNWNKAIGKTPSEYEVRLQALSTQLSMAQTQITGLESQIHNHRQHAAQLEHQLFTTQQEKLALTTQNTEIFSVMKTLEAAVESLQKEKDTLKFEYDTLKKKYGNFQKEKNVLFDQITYLKERNITLLKRSNDLLDNNKINKEKFETCERELIHLKIHTETIEKRFNELEEQNNNALRRISVFENRERAWANEKLAMEQRIKDLLATEKRTQEEMRQLKLKEIAAATAVAALQNNNNVNDSFNDLNGIEAEHLKALSVVVESLHAHHQTELKRTKMKIESLIRGRQSL